MGGAHALRVLVEGSQVLVLHLERVVEDLQHGDHPAKLAFDGDGHGAGQVEAGSLRLLLLVPDPHVERDRRHDRERQHRGRDDDEDPLPEEHAIHTRRCYRTLFSAFSTLCFLL
jgi:hypothetical protein